MGAANERRVGKFSRNAFLKDNNMGKVRVTCEVDTCNDTAKPSIRIHNHRNRNDCVELEVDGNRYVVSGKEMKIAIDNCMNAGF